MQEIGAHCSEAYCKQLDFLPFTCSLCSKVYCLEHFRPDKHDCPNQASVDRRVTLCPICEFPLPLFGGDADMAALFQAHESSGECKLKLTEKENKKKIHCPVEGCRAVLGPSSTYFCSTCRHDTCLRHRHASDHNCAELKKKTLSAWRTSAWSPAASRPSSSPGVSGNGNGGVANFLKITQMRRAITKTFSPKSL